MTVSWPFNNCNNNGVKQYPNHVLNKNCRLQRVERKWHISKSHSEKYDMNKDHLGTKLLRGINFHLVSYDSAQFVSWLIGFITPLMPKMGHFRIIRSILLVTPCITKQSAVRVAIKWDKQVLVFYRDEFWITVSCNFQKIYCQTSNIGCTKSDNLNVCCLILQLFCPMHWRWC